MEESEKVAENIVEMYFNLDYLAGVTVESRVTLIKNAHAFRLGSHESSRTVRERLETMYPDIDKHIEEAYQLKLLDNML